MFERFPESNTERCTGALRSGATISFITAFILYPSIGRGRAGPSHRRSGGAAFGAPLIHETRQTTRPITSLHPPIAAPEGPPSARPLSTRHGRPPARLPLCILRARQSRPLPIAAPEGPPSARPLSTRRPSGGAAFGPPQPAPVSWSAATPAPHPRCAPCRSCCNHARRGSRGCALPAIAYLQYRFRCAGPFRVWASGST
jgi:hypothetical protein